MGVRRWLRYSECQKIRLLKKLKKCISEMPPPRNKPFQQMQKKCPRNASRIAQKLSLELLREGLDVREGQFFSNFGAFYIVKCPKQGFNPD